MVIITLFLLSDGALLLSQGEYKKALPYIKEPFQLGWAYENLSQFDSAILYYKKANNILEPHSFYRIGVCLKHLGKYEEAIKYYNKVLNNYPDFVRINNVIEDLILCYIKLEKYNEAIALLNKLSPPHSVYMEAKINESMNKKASHLWINIAKNYPESNYAIISIDKISEPSLIGRVYYFHKEYKKAIKYLKKTEMYKDLLCMSLYKLKKYKEALSIAKSNGLWLIAGMCAERLGKKDLAIQYYMKSNAPDAYFYLAQIFVSEGKYREALFYYTNTPKTSEFFELAQMRGGLLALKLKMYLQADTAFNKISPPASYYWLYRLYKEQGDKEKSIYYIDKLTAEYPISYYSWRVLEEISPDLWLRGRIKNSIINIEPKEWLSSYSHPISEEEIKTINRAKSLFEMGIVQEGSLEMRSLNNLILLWEGVNFCSNLGLHHIALHYGKKLFKAGKLPKAMAKVLYPLPYLEIIQSTPEQIDEFLFLALIRQESHFNPQAISVSNAMGLTQIIPQTAKKISKELGIKKYDIFDPKTNIRFGSYYFDYCLKTFNDNLECALAAYNGGPHRVAQWLKEIPTIVGTDDMAYWVEFIPIKETRLYVKKVIENYLAYDIIYE